MSNVPSPIQLRARIIQSVYDRGQRFIESKEDSERIQAANNYMIAFGEYQRAFPDERVRTSIEQDLEFRKLVVRCECYLASFPVV